MTRTATATTTASQGGVSTAPSDAVTISQWELLSAKVDANRELVQAYASGLTVLEISVATFGVLIAFLVIYLGLRVEKSAIKAATDESISRLNEARAEIDKCVAEAKAASDRVSGVLIELEGHKEVAALDVAKIRTMRTEIEISNPKRGRGGRT